MTPSVRTPWWRDEPALERVVRDLLAFELAQARPGRGLPPQPWPAGLDLTADLGADSLDLMAAATALGDLLGSYVGNGAIDRPLLSNWVAHARATLECGDAGLVFRTSGSSGTPKRCAHRLDDLWREVDALAALVPGRRRVLSAVPAHHIYGFLFTVLLPQAAAHGHPALPVLDLRAASPAALAAVLAPGDLVVAHPDYWAQVAALTPRFPADVIGVTSTAPCPDAVAASLAAGGLRLLQVYGSSETGGVGWRDAAGAPYRLLPYWRRTQREDTLERDGPGATVDRHVVQDRLLWSAAERFLPDGRIDSAVQVGGTNVFPAYVAEVLAMHPAVAACVVRPMRADEGRRLKAFVVAQEGGGDPAKLRALLGAWLAERLSPAECPAAYSFGPSLPRQPNGKPADWIIDAWE